jgi:hypothetical protein
MEADELARLLAESIAQHQWRGLVDPATGIEDVVIHGRVNMLAVAKDVLGAMSDRPGPRSWGSWFTRDVQQRRAEHRKSRIRRLLEERLASGESEVDAALLRLRLRDVKSGPDGRQTD